MKSQLLMQFFIPTFTEWKSNVNIEYYSVPLLQIFKLLIIV